MLQDSPQTEQEPTSVYGALSVLTPMASLIQESFYLTQQDTDLSWSQARVTGYPKSSSTKYWLEQEAPKFNSSRNRRQEETTHTTFPPIDLNKAPN
jgi:hypothetical protein